jgi:replicative DNA helicase
MSDRKVVTKLRDDDGLYRLPPINAEAESALLGGLFVQNSAYGQVSDFLKPEHFGFPVNGRIFAAIGTLIERGSSASPVTLRNLFDQDAALTDIGGGEYLAKLALSAVNVLNIPEYGRRIYDLYLRRQLIHLGEDIVDDGYREDLNDTPEDQIDRATEGLYALSAGSITRADSGIRSAGVGAAEATARTEANYKGGTALSGLSTGLQSLDDLTGGLQKKSVIYVAAQAGVGKTNMAVGILMAVGAIPGMIPLFFSIELSREDIGRRFMAAMTGISVPRQLRGQLSQSEFGELVKAQQILEASALLVDDTTGLTLGQLCQRARMQKRRKGLHLIVVDYVQLLRSLNRDGETLSNSVKLAAFGLRDLARELDVPIVALSQLHRLSREDQRPQMNDMRDAGELEETAGAVVMIYRRELVLKKAEPTRGPKESDLAFDERHAKWSSALENSRGRVELLVEKNRSGELGTARCMLDAARGVFIDVPSNQGGFW